MIYVWGMLAGLLPFIWRSCNAQGKIVIAMDERKGLNPLAVSSDLFEFRLLSHSTNIISDVDLVTHANWSSLRCLYDMQHRDLPIYLRNNNAATALFQDNAEWKAWMASIGLGNFVPRTYFLHERHDIKFPLMLKVNRHSKGVVTIRNKSQFTQQVGRIIARGQPYTLEEALTGMGLSEVFTYGSVYKGTLLSMRCIKRQYPANFWHSDSVSQAEQNDTPFVGSYTMNSEEEHYIPCSQELVNVTRTMFAAAPPYSGAFCSSLKSDTQGRSKMMEVNTRYCGSMISNEGLLAAAYVPLSFAVHRDLPRALARRAKWVSDPLYLRIDAMEKEVLKSGGGDYEGRRMVVNKFNHTLTVDTPVYVSKSLRTQLSKSNSKEWWHLW